MLQILQRSPHRDAQTLMSLN
uniref:Uncharacterized protein n=1 Tax=Anguilla anguilla TaxID=7936 RepID=A0A0E9UTW2_ANGAN